MCGNTVEINNLLQKCVILLTTIQQDRRAELLAN